MINYKTTHKYLYYTLLSSHVDFESQNSYIGRHVGIKACFYVGQAVNRTLRPPCRDMTGTFTTEYMRKSHKRNPNHRPPKKEFVKERDRLHPFLPAASSGA